VLHLRVIVPADRTATVRDRLSASPAVTNLALIPGAALDPPGDLLICDVAREGANEILECLRELDIERDGSIAMETVDLSLSDAAQDAKDAAPGHGVDAVVWEEVTARTQEEAVLSVAYLVFMSIATMIAACGVLLDNPILIVGAMVVGPEFGPLAGLCVGLVQARRDVALRSATALLVGFPVGMLATIAFAWLMRALDLFDPARLAEPRPLTSFIWHPDALSFVVAFLAGAAGILSLTAAKSGALVGVLISVTTVPAAANAALALAYGDVVEARGSSIQLALNLVGIVVAGTLTLLVQLWYWSRHENGVSR
jgi:uncharacterized hydrophobic protein (TIGR00271 family)